MISIEAWWDKLTPSSQDWLRLHNDEPMPVAVSEEVVRAGGPATSDARWPGVSAGPTGFYMSDSAHEWIESLSSNDEA